MASKDPKKVTVSTEIQVDTKAAQQEAAKAGKTVDDIAKSMAEAAVTFSESLQKSTNAIAFSTDRLSKTIDKVFTETDIKRLTSDFSAINSILIRQADQFQKNSGKIADSLGSINNAVEGAGTRGDQLQRLADALQSVANAKKELADGAGLKTIVSNFTDENISNAAANVNNLAASTNALSAALNGLNPENASLLSVASGKLAKDAKTVESAAKAAVGKAAAATTSDATTADVKSAEKLKSATARVSEIPELRSRSGDASAVESLGPLISALAEMSKRIEDAKITSTQFARLGSLLSPKGAYGRVIEGLNSTPKLDETSAAEISKAMPSIQRAVNSLGDLSKHISARFGDDRNIKFPHIIVSDQENLQKKLSGYRQNAEDAGKALKELSGIDQAVIESAKQKAESIAKALVEISKFQSVNSSKLTSLEQFGPSLMTFFSSLKEASDIAGPNVMSDAERLASAVERLGKAANSAPLRSLRAPAAAVKGSQSGENTPSTGRTPNPTRGSVDRTRGEVPAPSGDSPIPGVPVDELQSRRNRKQTETGNFLGTGITEVNEILPVRGPIVQLAGLLFLLEGAFFGVQRAFERMTDSIFGANIRLEQYNIALSASLASTDEAKAAIEGFAKPFAAQVPFFQFDEIIEVSNRLASEGFNLTEITGFSLEQLSEASKKAIDTFADASKGLDVASSEGLVASITGAAAIFGKTADQATDAFISAVQGRFVKIRRFGIDQSTLSQFGFSGQESDVAGREQALRLIYQQRFGGVLSRQSETFKGIISNLQDLAGNISEKTFKPSFDFVKSELYAIADALSQLNPTLQSSSVRTSLFVKNIESAGKFMADMAKVVTDGIKELSKFGAVLAAALSVPVVLTFFSLFAFGFQKLIKSVVGFIGVYDKMQNKLKFPDLMGFQQLFVGNEEATKAAVSARKSGQLFEGLKTVKDSGLVAGVGANLTQGIPASFNQFYGAVKELTSTVKDLAKVARGESVLKTTSLTFKGLRSGDGAVELQNALINIAKAAQKLPLALTRVTELFLKLATAAQRKNLLKSFENIRINRDNFKAYVSQARTDISMRSAYQGLATTPKKSLNFKPRADLIKALGDAQSKEVEARTFRDIAREYDDSGSTKKTRAVLKGAEADLKRATSLVNRLKSELNTTTSSLAKQVGKGDLARIRGRAKGQVLDLDNQRRAYSRGYTPRVTQVADDLKNLRVGNSETVRAANKAGKSISDALNKSLVRFYRVKEPLTKLRPVVQPGEALALKKAQDAMPKTGSRLVQAATDIAPDSPNKFELKIPKASSKKVAGFGQNLPGAKTERAILDRFPKAFKNAKFEMTIGKRLAMAFEKFGVESGSTFFKGLGRQMQDGSFFKSKKLFGFSTNIVDRIFPKSAAKLLQVRLETPFILLRQFANTGVGKSLATVFKTITTSGAQILKTLTVTIKSITGIVAGFATFLASIFTGVFKFFLLPAILDVITALMDMNKGIKSIKTEALKRFLDKLKEVGKTAETTFKLFGAKFAGMFGSAGFSNIDIMTTLLDIINGLIKKLPVLADAFVLVYDALKLVSEIGLRGLGFGLQYFNFGNDELVNFGTNLDKIADKIKNFDRNMAGSAKGRSVRAFLPDSIKSDLKAQTPVLDVAAKTAPNPVVRFVLKDAANNDPLKNFADKVNKQLQEDFLVNLPDGQQKMMNAQAIAEFFSPREAVMLIATRNRAILQEQLKFLSAQEKNPLISDEQREAIRAATTEVSKSIREYQKAINMSNSLEMPKGVATKEIKQIAAEADKASEAAKQIGAAVEKSFTEADKEVTKGRNRFFAAQAQNNKQLANTIQGQIEDASASALRARIKGVQEMGEALSEAEINLQKIQKQKEDLEETQRGTLKDAVLSVRATLESSSKVFRDAFKNGTISEAVIEDAIKNPDQEQGFEMLKRYLEEAGVSGKDLDQASLLLRSAVGDNSKAYVDQAASLKVLDKAAQNAGEQVKSLSDKIVKANEEIASTVSTSLSTTERLYKLGRITLQESLDRTLGALKLANSNALLKNDPAEEEKRIEAVRNKIEDLIASFEKLSDERSALNNLDMGLNLKDSAELLGTLPKLIAELGAIDENTLRDPEVLKLQRKAMEMVINAANAQIEYNMEIKFQLLEHAGILKSIARTRKVIADTSKVEAGIRMSIKEIDKSNLSAINERNAAMAETIELQSKIAGTESSIEDVAAKLQVYDETLQRLKDIAKMTGLNGTNTKKALEVEQDLVQNILPNIESLQQDIADFQKMKISQQQRLNDLSQKELEIIRSQRDASDDMAEKRKNNIQKMVDFEKKMIELATGRSPNKQTQAMFDVTELNSLVEQIKSTRDAASRFDIAGEFQDKLLEAKKAGTLTTDQFQNYFNILKTLRQQFRGQNFDTKDKREFARTMSELDSVRSTIVQVDNQLAKTTKAINDYAGQVGNLVDDMRKRFAQLSTVLAAINPDVRDSVRQGQEAAKNRPSFSPGDPNNLKDDAADRAVRLREQTMSETSNGTPLSRAISQSSLVEELQRAGNSLETSTELAKAAFANDAIGKAIYKGLQANTSLKEAIKGSKEPVSKNKQMTAEEIKKSERVRKAKDLAALRDQMKEQNPDLFGAVKTKLETVTTRAAAFINSAESTLAIGESILENIPESTKDLKESKDKGDTVSQDKEMQKLVAGLKDVMNRMASERDINLKLEVAPDGTIFTELVKQLLSSMTGQEMKTPQPAVRPLNKKS